MFELKQSFSGSGFIASYCSSFVAIFKTVPRASNSNTTTSSASMWPVRTRRGTRKRCAALFVVGVCAAVMVLTRPFVTAPGATLTEDGAVAAALSAANGTTTTTTTTTTSSSQPLNNEPTVAGADLLPPPSQDRRGNQPPPPLPSVEDDTAEDPAVATSTAGTAEVAPRLAASEDSIVVRNASEPAANLIKTNVAATGSAPIAAAEVTSAPPPVPPAAGAASFTSSSNQGPSEVASVTGPTTPAVTTTTTSTTTTTKATTTTPPGVMATVDKTDPHLPTIYVITPTFPRMEQIPELTRLSQTLMHVPKLFWIVAEDAARKTPEVVSLLARVNLPSAHVLGAMPDSYRKKKGGKPKGVANRMAGLQWIRKFADSNGVMFFADDDNSYDIRLFEEMRHTKKVSMWPVGLVTQLGVSTPVVRNGRVVDFYDGWIASRKFPVDMAGFAVNVGFLKSRPNATMPFKAGFEEDGFLRSLNITLGDIEPKANNCTKILVWHTRTVSNKPPQKLSTKDRKKFVNTNLLSLPHIV